MQISKFEGLMPMNVYVLIRNSVKGMIMVLLLVHGCLLHSVKSMWISVYSLKDGVIVQY